MKQTLKLFGLLLIMAFSFTASSCSDDKNDEPSASASLVGTWTYEKPESSKDDDEGFKMILKFNKDNTGTYTEEWVSNETRASSSQTMNFGWSISTDSKGNDILRISYVSGDRDTMLFPQDPKRPNSNIVLWSYPCVLTGKVLNVTANSPVDFDDFLLWVFNRK